MKLSTALKVFIYTLIILTMGSEVGFAQNNPAGSIVNYASNGTPTHGIKIKTNLPYQTSMPTVLIEGFQYGNSEPINITLNWYFYTGKFFNHRASSSGAWTPTIKLAQENNKIVIFIDDLSYYTHFNVRAYGQSAFSGDADANYSGWTIVDNEDLTGTNVVTVPYKNRMGEVYVNGRVGIGTTKPKQKLHINGGGNILLDGGNIFLRKPITTGGWARGFLNENLSGTRLGGVGLLGTGSNEIKHYFMAHGIDPWDSGLGIYVKTDGKTGIGTTTPQAKLHVIGADNNGTTAAVRITSDNGAQNMLIDGAEIDALSTALVLNQNSDKDITMAKGGGNVIIGNVTAPTGYRLYVEKGILTEKLKVAVPGQPDWSDYVFEPDYQLKSLEEVEDFVKENKHLPNVPSAKEMVANGLDVAKMDATLLRQIEELWLHMIEMKKEIKDLKTENSLLKSNKK